MCRYSRRGGGGNSISRGTKGWLSFGLLTVGLFVIVLQMVCCMVCCRQIGKTEVQENVMHTHWNDLSMWVPWSHFGCFSTGAYSTLPWCWFPRSIPDNGCSNSRCLTRYWGHANSKTALIWGAKELLQWHWCLSVCTQFSDPYTSIKGSCRIGLSLLDLPDDTESATALSSSEGTCSGGVSFAPSLSTPNAPGLSSPLENCIQFCVLVSWQTRACSQKQPSL